MSKESNSGQLHKGEKPHQLHYLQRVILATRLSDPKKRLHNALRTEWNCWGALWGPGVGADDPCVSRQLRIFYDSLASVNQLNLGTAATLLQSRRN